MAATTYHNTSLISMQLTATNDNTTSALYQLDTNQGHITTKLDTVNRNITSVQEHVTNLQMYITSLQMQVGDIQLYCGLGEWHQVAYLNMSDPSQHAVSIYLEGVQY